MLYEVSGIYHELLMSKPFMVIHKSWDDKWWYWSSYDNFEKALQAADMFGDSAIAVRTEDVKRV